VSVNTTVFSILI